MTEIIDETDRSTGHRKISSVLQNQAGKQPGIYINVLLFGDSAPLISGTGSFQIQFSWLGSAGISELAHARRSVQNGQAAEYGNFHWLISSQPTKLGDKYQVAKTAATESAPESLGFFIHFTVDELRRIAFAKSVECRLDVLEFHFGQDVRDGIAKVLSLLGDVKTIEQKYEKVERRLEQNPPTATNKAPSVGTYRNVAPQSASISNAVASVFALFIAIIFVSFALSRCGNTSKWSSTTSSRTDGEKHRETALTSPGKTYTPAELRSMVNSERFPNQGAPSTTKQVMSFSECVTKVDGVVDSVKAQYPTRPVVNTQILYLVKVWTNDAAMTFTCSAPDGTLVITTAKYM